MACLMVEVGLCLEGCIWLAADARNREYSGYSHRVATVGTNIVTPENIPKTSIMKQANEAYVNASNLSGSQRFPIKSIRSQCVRVANIQPVQVFDCLRRNT